jgi:hypothetical protein
MIYISAIKNKKIICPLKKGKGMRFLTIVSWMASFHSPTLKNYDQNQPHFTSNYDVSSLPQYWRCHRQWKINGSKLIF